jgi:hypothetical protein
LSALYHQRRQNGKIQTSHQILSLLNRLRSLLKGSASKLKRKIVLALLAAFTAIASVALVLITGVGPFLYKVFAFFLPVFELGKITIPPAIGYLFLFLLLYRLNISGILYSVRSRSYNLTISIFAVILGILWPATPFGGTPVSVVLQRLFQIPRDSWSSLNIPATAKDILIPLVLINFLVLYLTGRKIAIGKNLQIRDASFLIKDLLIINLCKKGHRWLAVLLIGLFGCAATFVLSFFVSVVSSISLILFFIIIAWLIVELFFKRRKKAKWWKLTSAIFTKSTEVKGTVVRSFFIPSSTKQLWGILSLVITVLIQYAGWFPEGLEFLFRHLLRMPFKITLFAKAANVAIFWYFFIVFYFTFKRLPAFCKIRSGAKIDDWRIPRRAWGGAGLFCTALALWVFAYLCLLPFSRVQKVSSLLFIGAIVLAGFGFIKTIAGKGFGKTLPDLKRENLRLPILCLSSTSVIVLKWLVVFLYATFFQPSSSETTRIEGYLKTYIGFEIGLLVPLALWFSSDILAPQKTSLKALLFCYLMVGLPAVACVYLFAGESGAFFTSVTVLVFMAISILFHVRHRH